jgi:hypothetical protein
MHAREPSRFPRPALLALAGAVALSVASCGGGDDDDDVVLTPLNPAQVAQGRQIFRSETFGDESFFTDVLRLNEPVDCKSASRSIPRPCRRPS